MVRNRIKMTVAEQKQQRALMNRMHNPQMTFEIKIQHQRHSNAWLCSVTITQILQTINGKIQR